MPAFGHEFWISPLKYQVEAGENIVADIRVGQNFAGSAFSFIPDRFVRFDMIHGDRNMPVPGRIGDRPALNVKPPEDGLWVLVHETTDSILTYHEWEKFVSFVAHKDLADVLEIHAERGLSETGFRESYRRFAKALVGVGAGAGADRELGLLTEIIVGKNPYTDDLTAGMPVQVLFEGAPRTGVQVEIFEKSPHGQVEIMTARTDGEGRAVFPVKPGHEYLVDAVKMLRQDPDDPAKEPVWRSLWAASTFAVPG